LFANILLSALGLSVTSSVFPFQLNVVSGTSTYLLTMTLFYSGLFHIVASFADASDVTRGWYKIEFY